VFSDEVCGAQYFVTTLCTVSLCVVDPRFGHCSLDPRSGIKERLIKNKCDQEKVLSEQVQEQELC
jgi:hypothetical protein